MWVEKLSIFPLDMIFSGYLTRRSSQPLLACLFVCLNQTKFSAGNKYWSLFLELSRSVTHKIFWYRFRKLFLSLLPSVQGFKRGSIFFCVHLKSQWVSTQYLIFPANWSRKHSRPAKKTFSEPPTLSPPSQIPCWGEETTLPPCISTRVNFLIGKNVLNRK